MSATSETVQFDFEAPRNVRGEALTKEIVRQCRRHAAEVQADRWHSEKYLYSMESGGTRTHTVQVTLEFK